MNPLARKGAELVIVAELRLRTHPNISALRKAVGLSAAEAASAIQSLRYQGKIFWDRLELSSSVLAGEEPAQETAVAPIAAEGGAAVASPPSNAPGPDDEDDDGVNDIANGHKDTDPKARVSPPDMARAGEVRAQRPEEASPATPADPGGGFVPKHLLQRAGVHAANTRAAGKPLPAPAHEPEIARLVREEVSDGIARRARARSTGTVRQPLEVRKFGIPDLDMSEAIGCMLTEEPIDVLRAVSRKHPAIWRRCVLLGRIRGERPIQILYAALERGLDQLDQSERQAA